MHEEHLLTRIDRTPGVLGGKPTVRGLRLTVGHVLSALAQGKSPHMILNDFPELEPEDLDACLIYARCILDQIIVLISGDTFEWKQLHARFPELDEELLGAVLSFARERTLDRLEGPTAS